MRLALLLLCAVPLASAGDLRVGADFEGGSARVQSIEQATRTVRFTPGGDPARGWPCWWYLRVEGAAPGEMVILDLAPSDLPARNNGQLTGKPLDASWCMPGRATFSTDAGATWQQTPPGHRGEGRMRYEVTAGEGPLLVAWGPPFTPKDTAALLERCGRAQTFELARTREGRPVLGLHLDESHDPARFGIWIQARQHAWESGGSWVCRGVTEWLAGESESARWLRQHAELFIVPIMDVDNAATGQGGKEADPYDHNRAWIDAPIYPEGAAAQQRLLALAREQRLDFFIDLHNPSPGDLQPFFFCSERELLGPLGLANRDAFLALARTHLNGPLPVKAEPRYTGPKYHPLWRQISGHWVGDHGNPATLAVCLETAWNTPQSTTAGYLAVGQQLGETIAEYFKTNRRQGKN